MQGEMYMKDNGLMIKLMDTVNIAILTEQNMRVIGKKTSNMETVLKLGQMAQNMTANTSKAKSMVLDDLHGPMVVYSMGNS